MTIGIVGVGSAVLIALLGFTGMSTVPLLIVVILFLLAPIFFQLPGKGR